MIKEESRWEAAVAKAAAQRHKTSVKSSRDNQESPKKRKKGNRATKTYLTYSEQYGKKC